MPRFFFDLDDGVTRTRDESGLEIKGLREARKAGIAVLPDLAREMLPDGDRHVFVCKVRDEKDKVVFMATLSLVAEWIVDEPESQDRQPHLQKAASG